MARRILALACTLAALGAHAIDLDESGSLKLTGFYQLTAGKVLSGEALGSSSPWMYQQWRCPCTIQNWEYVGVYEKDRGWQTTPESLVGVQIKKDFNDTLSGTVQLVSRGNNTNYRPYTPTVDWAYLTWKPNADSKWSFQAGRKRIPLYYYSDYLYIGYAYPWVRPAPDVYGWPIYSYEGVNATYETPLGNSNWQLTANTWFGSHRTDNDAYDTLIYYTTPTNESWKRILGGWVSLNNGTYDIRLMMMHHTDRVWQNNADGSTSVITDDLSTRIMGFSANADFKDWVVRSEFDRFEQKAVNFIYNYALLGVGYHIGPVTPMVTFSHYNTQPNPYTSVEARNTRYYSVRWDFRKNMALKLQYDDSKDLSKYSYPFFGSSKLLSVSLQGIF
jgi:hypothetical protein